MSTLFFKHKDQGCQNCSYCLLLSKGTTWPLLITVVQCWAESLFLLFPLLHGSVHCTWADFPHDCMLGAWIVGKIIIYPNVPSFLSDKSQQSSAPDIQIQYGCTKPGSHYSDLILSWSWLGNHPHGG